MMARCVAAALLVPTVLAAQSQAPGTAGRVRALIDSGHVANAEAVARADRGSLALLGDILVQRGRLAAADSAYAAAIVAGIDVPSAQVGRAELAIRRHDESSAITLATRVADDFESRGASWSARDRIAAGRAYVVLGVRDPASVRTALAVFDKVAADTPGDVESRVRAADLLLDKYNAPDARKSYDEVLALEPNNPRALAGLARARTFEGDANAIQQVRQALAINPQLVTARLHLARLHLEAESYDSATIAAEAALAVDSTAVTAWGTLGAIAWLRGDEQRFATLERAVRAVDPRPADFYTEVAEASARHRRYADAVVMAERGVALDSKSSRALGVLGTNNLRIGKLAEGRAQLERAFARDAYHVWNKNTLDLLESMRGFTTVDTGRFQFVAPATDIGMVVATLSPLLESAFDTLVQRYDYRPATPVRLEVFRSHADFSVRTVGLAGLGALGVSFGRVLAMDAPAAREPGSFNFGSTAWHELTHTFTLGASDNRVPRWISEGLSVLEERRSRPGWGAHLTLEFLGALKAGQIVPVSRINEALVRPRHPLEIGFAYYQASLVMEMIEAERGAAGLRAMLGAFRDGMDTPAVLQRVLGISPDSLDARFARWMSQRFAVGLGNIDPWTSQGPVSGSYVEAVGRGRALLAAGDVAGASTELRRARQLMPAYGGPDGAAWPLAQARLALADTAGALEALGDITSRAETALEPNLVEARLRMGRGDFSGAVGPLERALWIDPMDIASRQQLADALERSNALSRALRERRVIVALAPPDLPLARFEVARLLMLTGDRVGARRAVLALLEETPSFERAQDLLLTLTGNR